jgi:hypothetical protein
MSPGFISPNYKYMRIYISIMTKASQPSEVMLRFSCF